MADQVLGELAVALIEEKTRPFYVERDAPAPYQIWGEGLEQGALDQMKNAVRLPVAVAGRSCPMRTWATACRSAACWRRRTRSSRTPSAWTSPAG